HGYPGDARNGESVGLPAVLDEAIAATGRGFVVALPDGGSAIHPDTEWADSADGKVRLDRFVTTTVIRAVEGNHRRDRRHRAIAGFSMGGYGAMNLGLRHPGLYGQVVSIAGYFHPDDPDRMGGGRAGWATANSPARPTPDVPVSGAPASAALRAVTDAVLGLAGEPALEPVLERLVHAVRDLVGARYAALGIPDEDGTGFDRFITSGMTDEQIEA